LSFFYCSQPKKTNTSGFPECLTVQEITELINGSDSEFDFSDNDEEDGIIDNTEPESMPADIIVPKKQVKPQSASDILSTDDLACDDCDVMDMSFMNISNLPALNNTLVEQLIDQIQEPFLNIQCTPKEKIRWIRRNNSFTRCDYQIDQNNNSVNTTADNTIDVTSPLEYFYKIFSHEFFESVAMFTNVYAAQKNVRGYKLATTAEIINLFGMQIAMGALKFPRLRLYWNRVLGECFCCYLYLRLT
jgi:hypothetical protein